jgi:hypothetical protein
LDARDYEEDDENCIVVGTYEGKRPLGRSRRRWKHII